MPVLSQSRKLEGGEGKGDKGCGVLDQKKERKKGRGWARVCLCGGEQRGGGASTARAQKGTKQRKPVRVERPEREAEEGGERERERETRGSGKVQYRR